LRNCPITAEPDLTRDTLLTFSIELRDGSRLETVGDAEAYLSDLSDRQQDNDHWGIAVRMFDNALQQPAYLKAATMALQTAMAMDGLLARMWS
jgi:hypothetical protein